MTPLAMADTTRWVATLGDQRWTGSGKSNSVAKDIVAQLGSGWKLRNHTARGATSSELRHAQLRRLFAHESLPRAVLISIGHADLSTAAIVPETFGQVLTNLAANIETTVSEIKRLLPESVVLMRAIDSDPAEPWPIPVAWMDGANTLLEKLAQRSGAIFVPHGSDPAGILIDTLRTDTAP